jgi:hypothetical protein
VGSADAVGAAGAPLAVGAGLSTVLVQEVRSTAVVRQATNRVAVPLIFMLLLCLPDR